VPALPVSVVIPAFRRPAEVRRAVESVRRQTCAPAEIIVVDDASGDDTAAAAEAAGASVLRLEQNVGEGGARNAGIEHANQDWIALLDSDDEWLPWHLERLWPERADHVVVGAACLAVGAGVNAGRVYGWCGPAPRVLRSPSEIVWPENVLPPSGAIVRREAVLRAGGFPLRAPQAGDLDAWIRLLEIGTGKVCDHISVLYHVHGDQASGDRHAMHQARLALYARYRGRSWYDPHLLRRMSAVDAWDLRDPSLLVRALIAPQGVVGLAQTFVHRRRQRRGARALRQTVSAAVPESAEDRPTSRSESPETTSRRA
jgi:glycosyltransferase involved in cell wall biosynthesis